MAPDQGLSGTVLVFLKYPEAGRVKTRIAATVGPLRAAELYRAMIDTVFTLVQPIRSRARVVGYFDGAPKSAFAEWHGLADEWWPQPTGDLGARLDAGFLAGADRGPVLAIGTDCLELDSAVLGKAFRVLAGHDAVFGPAHDGGYYLVGTARHLGGFFEGIPWSCNDTLAAHLALCRRNRWSFELLPELHDIDTHNDWVAHCRRKGRTDVGS